MGKLQYLLDEVVKAHPSFAWARNITINHQLCSQKYRNLKKVYILSKQSDRKKFAYKEQFKEIEDLDRSTRQPDSLAGYLNGALNYPQFELNLSGRLAEMDSTEIKVEIDENEIGNEIDENQIEEIHLDENESPNISSTHSGNSKSSFWHYRGG